MTYEKAVISPSGQVGICSSGSEVSAHPYLGILRSSGEQRYCSFFLPCAVDRAEREMRMMTLFWVVSED